MKYKFADSGVETWYGMVCSILILLFMPGLNAALVAQNNPSGPNIILILTDDQGWSCSSVQMDNHVPESKSDYFQTPHLERLASAGMRFTNGYSPAALCCPTRRSIQFGQTPARQGDETFKKKYYPDGNGIPSIPMVLKSINPDYQAAHYGKWDLRADIFPEDLGYDESDGNTGNRNGNMNSNKVTKWTDFYINNDPKRIESLTGRALNFMERNVKNGTPFYLQISHYAIHVDIQTKQSSFDRFWRKEPGLAHGNPGFGGMLFDLDAGIGRILDKIHELGIEDKTYIVFMADNGAVELVPQTSAKLINPTKYTRPRRNHPLRGGKWTLYEGGIRMPFIIAGPGIAGGSQSDVPVAGWDLLPTFAELAGKKTYRSHDIDGGSLKTVLLSKGKGTVQRNTGVFVFHRYHDSYPHTAIRSGNYKLVKHWKSGKMELFDLSTDLEEIHDIAGQRPDLVEELYSTLISYLEAVNSEILQIHDPA